MKFEPFNAQYVRQLADGDPTASDHFAEYFGKLLFLKLRVRLRSVELIKDIRQETLARVLEVVRQGSGVNCPERFGPFVNGVCENVIREYCRWEGRAEPWEDHMEEPVDPKADLDAALLSADMRRSIDRVFAHLPEKDRKVLKAIFLDEIDKAEVCRLFQVNPDYLRVLIHRAKEQYRRVYFQLAAENGVEYVSPVNPGKG